MLIVLTDHFNELTPVLSVSDMQRSIAFYLDKLGMTKAWEWPNEEPNQFGLKISQKAHRDQIQLSLSDTKFETSGWIFVNVSNIDLLYEKYVKKGVQFSQDIDNFPWGYREFWVNDPDGNQIRFTMELSDHNQG